MSAHVELLLVYSLQLYITLETEELEYFESYLGHLHQNAVITQSFKIFL
jgi:hypothetical protein